MHLNANAHAHPFRERSRLLAITVSLLLLGLLAGCMSSGAPGPDGAWVMFGPFKKRAEFDEPGMTGPAEVWIPEVGVVELDAATLLPDAEVTSERYTYAFDGDTPIIVGVVQTQQTVYYRRHSETLHLTYVLGISAEREPQVLTTFRAFRGGEHTVSLTGLTDLGVVVIFLEGELVEGEPDSTRLEGVDAVRGTDVWWKQNGYPGGGDGASAFYSATAWDACAQAVEEYAIASGIPIRSEEFPNQDEGAGGACKRASDPN